MDRPVAVIIGGASTGHRDGALHQHHQSVHLVYRRRHPGELSGLVVPGTEIDFSAFISAVINFLIVAFIVFLLVKAVNKAWRLPISLRARKRKKKRSRPYLPCLEEVKEGATRCLALRRRFDEPREGQIA